jgi:ribokinase
MIIVFGSVGADLVTNVSHIPHPGETVLCEGYIVVPGSKGGNQAVAAARAGSPVQHVGSCGDDGFAPLALSIMKEAGVDLTHVATISRPTAVALITVDEKAENAIVVASGANRATHIGQLEACPFGAGDTLVLQREIPDEATFAAVALAKSRGARVILNVAPAGPVPAETLRLLDVLVVNEHEALVVGKAVGLFGDDPEETVQEINKRFGCAAIVTLGAAGAVGWTDGVRRAVPALKVTPVDTTAAGDAFTGAFAAALDQGMGFTTALARGAAAGSLACTSLGAQPSIPTKAEIDAATIDSVA